MSNSAGTDSSFARLEDVILDDRFPDVDLTLRRGRHIGREDGEAYELLVDALDHLEPLYRRFGCELVHQSDGYFYLLPLGDRVRRRHLSAGEMLVGQALALLYLEPATLQTGGVISRERLLERLVTLVGEKALVRTLNPRRRKYDERVAAEAVRASVAVAVRRLSDLGFLDLVDEEQLRVRPALMRFAEPVRGLEDTTSALERLAATGEIMTPDDSADDDADESNGVEETE